MDGPYETLAELDNGRVGGRLGIIHVNPVCDPKRTWDRSLQLNESGLGFGFCAALACESVLTPAFPRQRSPAVGASPAVSIASQNRHR